MISEFEKKMRAEHYEYVKATMGFEGAYMSRALDNQYQKYVRGDISREEFDEYMDARILGKISNKA